MRGRKSGMEEKILYWLDGKLMGERTEEEVEGIIRIAKASGYIIRRRPGHIFVFTVGEGNKESQDQQEETLE
jgi:hypothetical protein